MRDVNHHAPHFDEDGAPASESVCHTYGRYSEADAKRLDTASRCYELLADKLSQDPSKELTLGFNNHTLRAQFSSGPWSRILVSYDDIVTTFGKLSADELKTIIQNIQTFG